MTKLSEIPWYHPFPTAHYDRYNFLDRDRCLCVALRAHTDSPIGVHWAPFAVIVTQQKTLLTQVAVTSLKGRVLPYEGVHTRYDNLDALDFLALLHTLTSQE